MSNESKWRDRLYRIRVLAAFVFWFGAASTMLIGLVDPLVSLAIALSAVIVAGVARFASHLIATRAR